MTGLPTSTRKTDGGRIKGAQPCANVIECTVVQSGANGKSANHTFHGSFTSAPANMQSLATALWTAVSGAWGTNLAPHMAPAAQISAVHVRDMTAPTNPVFIGTGTAVPGTGTIPALPGENAVVITENVSIRGKGLKGRMYVSGFVVGSDAGAGIIDPATVTAVTNYGNAIFAALNTNSLTPCVAQLPRQSYIGLTGTQHLSRPAGHPPVSSYTVNNAWDTQRRRGQ